MLALRPRRAGPMVVETLRLGPGAEPGPGGSGCQRHASLSPSLRSPSCQQAHPRKLAFGSVAGDSKSDWAFRHRLCSRGRESPDTAERYQAPRRSERVQRKRNTDDDDVKTAKKTPASEELKETKGQSENSSIVTIGPITTRPRR